MNPDTSVAFTTQTISIPSDYFSNYKYLRFDFHATTGITTVLSIWVDCTEFPNYTVDSRIYIATSYNMSSNTTIMTRRVYYVSDNSVGFTNTLQWKSGTAGTVANDYLIPTQIIGLR